MAKIIISTNSYNDRRYGKPWIARVDFSQDPQGKFLWGDWIGQPGEGGELSIEASPGDVVASGQKDFRKPRNSAPDWYTVGSDGELISHASKIEAVRAARAFAAARPSADVISIGGGPCLA